MASGASGVTPGASTRSPRRAPRVCADLARQLIGDAEGADHDIAIEVADAATRGRRRSRSAAAIARNNLFKCAVFGKDPNWGRVLAAVGTTQAAFDPADLDVAINGVWVCRGRRSRRRPVARRPVGPRGRTSSSTSTPATRSATVWTNDLTHDYVHENSAYST